MLQTAILDEVTGGRFNPAAIVDQLQMLPVAVPTPELVAEIEGDFLAARRAREDAMASLASMMAEETFKDDGEEFATVIASYERHAKEVGRKLQALEKRVLRAQKTQATRDRDLDDRLLRIARQDFEDRIDLAMFWRALQARQWPTPVSEAFDNGASIGDALRAALG